jgi:hypothetical protein
LRQREYEQDLIFIRQTNQLLRILHTIQFWFDLVGFQFLNFVRC